MKYSSPYQKAVGAFAYAQNSIIKAIKSTHIQDDISNLKRDLNDDHNSNNNQHSYQRDYGAGVFRAPLYQRINSNLSPIKERASDYKEPNPKTYTNKGNNIDPSSKDIDKDEEYYNPNGPYSQSYPSDNYLKRLIMSFNSFKFDKMLMLNHINIHTLQTTEITVPLLTLAIFLIVMLLKGRCWIKSLYCFVLLFPILNWFLINQIASSLMKYKPQVKKIGLMKSIVFFYSAFIPICFASLCLLILRRRSFVGVICLIIAVTFSSFLNEKYHSVYCGLEFNNNRIILLLNGVIYSFFIIVIV